MFKRMPGLIMGLVAAMLVGLVGHGVELFYAIEGGGFYGLVKALGFPLAFECGNAVGLYIGFNRQTKGAATRFVALLIGTACVVTSYLIQFHYFTRRIEADWWYAGVLPGLVALLSALAGLLDRDLSQSQPTEAKPLPRPELTGIEARIAELQGALQEMASAVRIIQSEPPTASLAPQAPQAPHDAPQPPQRAAQTASQIPQPPQRAAQKTIGDGAADSGGASEPAAPLTIAALLGAEWLAGQALAVSDPPAAPTATALLELAPQTADPPQLEAAPPESAPQEQREAWCYRTKQAGCSYSQIGQLLGKSADTARRYAQTHAKRHGLELK